VEALRETAEQLQRQAAAAARRSSEQQAELERLRSLELEGQEEAHALRRRLEEAEAAVAESLALQQELLAGQAEQAAAAAAAGESSHGRAFAGPPCAVHAAVEWKVGAVFTHFDADGDGVLSEAELKDLLRTVNPHMQFTDEHLQSITDEVLQMYPAGLPLQGLLNTYLSDDSDGGNIDHDLDVLRLPACAPCSCAPQLLIAAENAAAQYAFLNESPEKGHRDPRVEALQVRLLPLPVFPTGDFGYRGVRGAAGLGYRFTVI
jgi:hypothetical protein